MNINPKQYDVSDDVDPMYVVYRGFKTFKNEKMTKGFNTKRSIKASGSTFERDVKASGRIHFSKVIALGKVISDGSSIKAEDSQLLEVCSRTSMILKDTIAKSVKISGEGNLDWNNSKCMEPSAESIEIGRNINLKNLVCKTVLSYSGTINADQCTLNTVDATNKIELNKTTVENATLGIYPGSPATITLNESIIKGDLIIINHGITIPEGLEYGGGGGMEYELTEKTFVLNFKDVKDLYNLLTQFRFKEGAEGSINGELYCCKERFLIPKDPNSKSEKYNNNFNITIVGGTILGKIIYEKSSVNLTLKDVKVLTTSKTQTESDAKFLAEEEEVEIWKV